MCSIHPLPAFGDAPTGLAGCRSPRWATDRSVADGLEPTGSSTASRARSACTPSGDPTAGGLRCSRSLLPAAARAVEAFENPPDAGLHPAEEACVARAVPARRREFTTGRLCARSAGAGSGWPRQLSRRARRRPPVASQGRRQHHPLRWVPRRGRGPYPRPCRPRHRRRTRRAVADRRPGPGLAAWGAGHARGPGPGASSRVLDRLLFSAVSARAIPQALAQVIPQGVVLMSHVDFTGCW